ncbi:hypothetical protein C2S51_002350 [Perilla frutescens var. frutescens]|nr:hypothetical protein C2S51_002350 [Perilla frutescens var. frutescens]
MLPPEITPQPTFEFPKPDSAQSSESVQGINFSAGSTGAARFQYSKTATEKPRVSSRSRPRLMRTRRRQMPDGKTVKTDLGLNGFSDGGGEKDFFEGKLENVFGINNGILGSNGGVEKSGDLNGNEEKFENGLDFDVGLDNSLFGFGSGSFTSMFDAIVSSMPSTRQSKGGDFLSGFDKGSSNFVQKETGDFVFGACKATPITNQGLNGLNMNGFSVDANLERGQFVSASSCNSSFSTKDPSDSASQVKLEQQGMHKSGSNSAGDEFVKFNSANFVFGASKTDKVAGSTIPDVRGKVKLDGSGASEKVCNPGLRFSYNLSDSSSNDHDNFVFTTHNTDFKFNVGLENSSACKKEDMSNFTDSGKENVEIGSQSQGACLNDVFIFGGLKGNGGIYSGGSTKPVDEMNQLNRGKVEDCNDFEMHNHNSSAGVNFKFQSNDNSGDSFDLDPAFSIENKMKKLNIGDSKVDTTRSGSFTNLSCFSQSNSKLTGTYSSLFPFTTGMGFELKGGFQEVPSMDKDENNNISFKGKLGGLGGLGSDADSSTPDMKFAFSSNNLFPGADKLGNANVKSLRGKKSKKRNEKLGQRTVVQQLFSQSPIFMESSSQKNHESPSCGSPMDFSPYQDTSANAPEADTAAGVKGESSANNKNILEHREKPQNDKSDSVFSPSLPAEDGLSAVRHQYKKKYRLKVGARGNSSDKENVKREPTGTPNEVCEHWRISNRAATRMSLARMREAIADCTKASELDPDFLKVILRAGNCYLVLGEVEDAIRCYTKCLRAETSICLDRRFTIEAAGSLQKAKKVAEYMNQSATLLEEGTDDAAGRALENIGEALSISHFSERLLQMKGEALYILRMYDEVIQLCEQTLDIAEKNFGADLLANPKGDSYHVKLWRWHLQSKSHYRLGRLDLALDLIEKQEKVPIITESEDVTKESSIALAINIRELLSLKKSGNEAFNSGKYIEAIENYTAAISKSYESRAFMAVCFCNRAAAYQSLSQIVDAISDCSVAIALDENYAKAISRRGTLHEMIRDYKQALNDVQRMASLLESQSQSKTQSRSSGGGSVRDLRKARRRLALIEEKTKKEIPLDLYLILGIKTSDAESEIKKAYRKAALRHHPDKASQVLVRSDAGDDGRLWKECGEKIHNDADRLFKIIGEAYAVLSDPSKRSKYDMEEEMRNNYRESNRNSSSEHPSTSYSSPYERGSWSGRSGGYNYSSSSSSTPSGRSRRNWYEAYPKSYSTSGSQWRGHREWVVKAGSAEEARLKRELLKKMQSLGFPLIGNEIGEFGLSSGRKASG